jgi:glycosyltransferase involved in cell wall biosynthesis
MKLLVLSPFVPDPAALSGAPRAIFDRLHLLADRNEITVIAMRASGERADAPALESCGVTLRTVRRRTLTAASSPRARRWKRIRLAIGLLVDPRPLLVQEFGDRTICAAIRTALASQRFDQVLVEHILMAQYIPCVRDGSPVRTTLSDHDVAASDTAGAGDWFRVPFKGWLARLDRVKWHRYTRRAYRSATSILVPTAEDARVVRMNVPDADVRVVPFGIADHVVNPVSHSTGVGGMRGGGREPSTLLFVGNFEHAPNRDAAHILATQIMPLVWQRNDETRLWLVGHAPTATILALRGSRIEVFADVDSVEPYLSAATLFVAPIRDGGGMRMKLLEAFESGIPVITTSLGSRGLGATAGNDIVIAESALEFTEAIVALLADRERRDRVGAAGRQLVASSRNRASRAAHLEQSLT